MPGMDADVLVVPRFVQIVTAAAHAYGRADDECLSSEVLYGLDTEGRVWQWNYADPARKGSKDGWDLMPATRYIDGEEPPVKRATR
jgi:hypothetical protein